MSDQYGHIWILGQCELCGCESYMSAAHFVCKHISDHDEERYSGDTPSSTSQSLSEALRETASDTLSAWPEETGTLHDSGTGGHEEDVPDTGSGSFEDTAFDSGDTGGGGGGSDY